MIEKMLFFFLMEFTSRVIDLNAKDKYHYQIKHFYEQNSVAFYSFLLMGSPTHLLGSMKYSSLPFY